MCVTVIYAISKSKIFLQVQKFILELHDAYRMLLRTIPFTPEF